MKKLFTLATSLFITLAFCDIPSHIVIEKKVTHEVASADKPEVIQKSLPCPKGEMLLYVGGNYHRTKLVADRIGTFKGNLMGALGGFSYKKDWGLYALLQVQGGVGRLNGVEPYNHIDQTELIFDERLGYVAKWGLRYKSRLIPYVGYRYMWLNEHREIVGYPILAYTYFKPYIPLGFMLDVWLSKWFSVGINYEFQWNINTYLNTSNLVGTSWFLKRKNDLQLQFPITLRPKEFLSITLMPYYRRVATGNSTAVTNSGLTLGLLSQQYTMWGVEIDLAYRF